MAKQQSSGSNKQSSPESGSRQSSSDSGARPSTETSKAKAGKDAESHTKADTGKGAGGGAKQGRKH